MPSLYSIIPPVRSTPFLYAEKKSNSIYYNASISKSKATRHYKTYVRLLLAAIATKQTILAILGCEKRYFAASEVSQISFDKQNM